MRTRSGAAASLAVVLTMLLAGCQWMSTGWDASGSADNTAESHIGVADVATLHTEWTATLGATGWDSPTVPVASGNDLFVVARPDQDLATTRLQAYSATGGAGCTGSPKTCPPLWQAQGTGFSQPLALDGVVYADHGGVLEAYDGTGARNCSGSPLVCTPLWSGTGPGLHPIAEGGRVYVAGNGEVDAYSTDPSGCTGTPVVCRPVDVYQSAPGCDSNPGCVVTALVADGTHLFAATSYQTEVTISFPGGPFQVPFITQHVLAYDLGGSGDPLWVHRYSYELGENPSPAALMDVNGYVYATSPGPNSFPIAGTLSGTTAISADSTDGTPAWASSGLEWSTAASPAAVFAEISGGLVACDPATGCGAATASDPLAPLRTYDFGTYTATNQIGGPVVANGVLYAIASDSASSVLLAFDANGHTGCSGTPVVCEPLATLPVPHGQPRLSITNGRVYVTALGHLVALDLPST